MARVEGRFTMKKHRHLLLTAVLGVVLVTFAALVGVTATPATATGASSAGTSAAKQRLAVTIRPAAETFQLSLSSTGSVVRDAGRVTWSTVGERSVTREGQRVRVWTGFGRFAGKRGDLVLRFRWEWLDAGRGYEAGVGTWTVARSTGPYAALRGTGRSAAVWLPQGPIASRVDGLVLPG
jgi:hypothetical protein